MTEKITTPEALDALPVGTHGIDRVCAPVWRQEDGWYAFLAGVVNQRRPVLPVVILHTPAPSTEDRETLDLARNIVNQVLDGAVEQGGYSLVDMGARQRFNDIADSFVADLLAARQPAPVDAEAGEVIDDHDYLPVAGHPDDDECTHRADGTDLTYCGEPREAHRG